MKPPLAALEQAVTAALAEDLGSGRGHHDRCHRSGRVDDRSGNPQPPARTHRGHRLHRHCLVEISEPAQVAVLAGDGTDVAPGDTVARLSGSARTVLTAERTILNLLCRMSGIATATAAAVRLVQGTRAVIKDTRKTTPGLRALEKYAVAVGGGVNHRFGLHDAVLVKDNHIALAGSITTAVERIRSGSAHPLPCRWRSRRWISSRRPCDAA